MDHTVTTTDYHQSRAVLCSRCAAGSKPRIRRRLDPIEPLPRSLRHIHDADLYDVQIDHASVPCTAATYILGLADFLRRRPEQLVYPGIPPRQLSQDSWITP